MPTYINKPHGLSIFHRVLLFIGPKQHHSVQLIKLQASILAQPKSSFCISNHSEFTALIAPRISAHSVPAGIRTRDPFMTIIKRPCHLLSLTFVLHKHQ